jgi:hypothetical protein
VRALGLAEVSWLAAERKINSGSRYVGPEASRERQGLIALRRATCPGLGEDIIRIRIGEWFGHWSAQGKAEGEAGK